MIDGKTAAMYAVGLLAVSWLFDFRDVPIVGRLDVIQREGSLF